jgi:hypothetical protein
VSTQLILVSISKGETSMNIKLATACVALLGMAACDTAVAPTQGQSDLNAATATYNSLRFNTRVPTSTDPTGGGTYTGKFGSPNVTVNSEGGYGIVGDIAMNVNFSGGVNNVTGSLTDINLIDRLVSEGSQVMTNGTGSRTPGSLNITGSEVGGAISATATGQLGAVLANTGSETTAQMNVPLSGQVRTTTVFGDTVTGTFTGTGTGSTFNGMDVSITGGSFYGRE